MIQGQSNPYKYKWTQVIRSTQFISILVRILILRIFVDLIVGINFYIYPLFHNSHKVKNDKNLKDYTFEHPFKKSQDSRNIIKKINKLNCHMTKMNQKFQLILLMQDNLLRLHFAIIDESKTDHINLFCYLI